MQPVTAQALSTQKDMTERDGPEREAIGVDAYWPDHHLLSSGSTWTGLRSQTQDLSREERIQIGTAHLIIGAVGVGGSVFAGIGAYSLFNEVNDPHEAPLTFAGGVVLAVGGASLLATGIVMTIRGIRILRGEDPPTPDPQQPLLRSSAAPFSMSLPK